MPSALYAISYRPTGSVVALCSFEKQDLVDKPAWDQLLATLIGARLPISMSSNGAAIEIAANELGVDLLKDPSRQDLELALAEPYRFRVSVDPEAATLPELGDGKEKVLRKANKNAVTAVALTAGSPAQVKVTLASPPPDGVNARLLFEGHAPATKDPPASKDPSASKELIFTLPSDVTIAGDASYGIVFFMEGTAVEARSVKAPPASMMAPVLAVKSTPGAVPPVAPKPNP